MSIHLSYGQAFTVDGMFPHFLVCHRQKCKRKEFLADEFAESQNVESFWLNVENTLVNFVEVRLSVDSKPRSIDTRASTRYAAT